MSDKVNITKLLALRDASRAKPSDLAAAYAYTKAVLDAADVLLEVARAAAVWSDSGFYNKDTKMHLTKAVSEVAL